MGQSPARRRQATQPAGHRRPMPARGSAERRKTLQQPSRPPGRAPLALPPGDASTLPAPDSNARASLPEDAPGRVATPKRPRRHRVASNVSHNGVVRGGSPAAGCWRMPEPSVKEWASDGKTRDGDAERPLMLPCPAGMPAPRAWPGPGPTDQKVRAVRAAMVTGVAPRRRKPSRTPGRRHICQSNRRAFGARQRPAPTRALRAHAKAPIRSPAKHHMYFCVIYAPDMDDCHFNARS